MKRILLALVLIPFAVLATDTSVVGWYNWNVPACAKYETPTNTTLRGSCFYLDRAGCLFLTVSGSGTLAFKAKGSSDGFFYNYEGGSCPYIRNSDTFNSYSIEFSSDGLHSVLWRTYTEGMGYDNAWGEVCDITWNGVAVTYSPLIGWHNWNVPACSKYDTATNMITQGDCLHLNKAGCLYLTVAGSGTLTFKARGSSNGFFYNYEDDACPYIRNSDDFITYSIDFAKEDLHSVLWRTYTEGMGYDNAWGEVCDVTWNGITLTYSSVIGWYNWDVPGCTKYATTENMITQGDCLHLNKAGCLYLTVAGSGTLTFKARGSSNGFFYQYKGGSCPYIRNSDNFASYSIDFSDDGLHSVLWRTYTEGMGYDNAWGEVCDVTWNDVAVNYSSPYAAVTFNANAGVCATSWLGIEKYTAAGELPTATRDGYHFLGWFTAAEDGTLVKEETKVTNDTAWYAQWEKVIVVSASEIESWVINDLAPKFKRQTESESDYCTRFQEKYGNDYSAAFLKETGKVRMNGTKLCVWHDYIIGTDPLDNTSLFRATLTFDDKGDPQIGYDPKFDDPIEAAKRTYTIYGKKTLNDIGWSVIDGDEASYHFFMVTVEMK